ncbi:MAG: hypothetical protein Q4B08_14045 [Propionibacteriaceae bacterium]|nr:hypothetical protein [Propionibacteriaceae bacterium]
MKVYFRVGALLIGQPVIASIFLRWPCFVMLLDAFLIESLTDMEDRASIPLEMTSRGLVVMDLMSRQECGTGVGIAVDAGFQSCDERGLCAYRSLDCSAHSGGDGGWIQRWGTSARQPKTGHPDS